MLAFSLWVIWIANKTKLQRCFFFFKSQSEFGLINVWSFTTFRIVCSVCVHEVFLRCLLLTRGSCSGAPALLRILLVDGVLPLALSVWLHNFSFFFFRFLSTAAEKTNKRCWKWKNFPFFLFPLLLDTMTSHLKLLYIITTSVDVFPKQVKEDDCGEDNDFHLRWTSFPFSLRLHLAAFGADDAAKRRASANGAHEAQSSY